MRIVAAASIALVVGCSPGEDEHRTSAVSDSAGVTIVHNAAWSDGENQRWTVEPVLSVGQASGDEQYIFGRIADATMDRAGRLLVLDQHAHVVRVYNADGTFVGDIGREGQGPGEFSDFVNAVLVGPSDSIYVADYPQARLSVFSANGDYARTVSLPPLPNGHSWAWSGSGGFLYRGMTISRNEQNRFDFWDAIIHVGPDGGPIDTVFVFDYQRTDIGGPGNIRVPLIVNSPFWDAAPGDRIVWSATDRNELYVFSRSGSVERIIRHEEWTHDPVTDTDHRMMVELLRRKLEMLGGAAGAADRPNVESGDYLPAITGVRAGPNNTIWVQRMGQVDDIDPWGINAPNRSEWLGGPVWDVLDADGRSIAVVRVPERFRMMRVMDQRIIGVQKDDLDVERVVVLRLTS